MATAYAATQRMERIVGVKRQNVYVRLTEKKFTGSNAVGDVIKWLLAEGHIEKIPTDDEDGFRWRGWGDNIFACPYDRSVAPEETQGTLL
jgi:hypothetical protein